MSGVICLGLSACATVDFAEMAPERDVAAATPVQENVAIRAAKALYTSFTSKGWSVVPDENPMQRAANVLLRGIGQSSKVVDTSYAGQVRSIAKVRADILLASQEVSKAQKAVDVFLDLATEESDLTSELEALEKAVGVSHKAELMFSRALKNVGAKDIKAEIDPLKSSVDGLEKAVDIYGDRVRSKAPIIGGAAS